MTAKKAAAAKKAAPATPAERPVQYVAWDRTRSRMVGGIRDNEEEAQTIVDGLVEAGYSAEVRTV